LPGVLFSAINIIAAGIIVNFSLYIGYLVERRFLSRIFHISTRWNQQPDSHIHVAITLVRHRFGRGVKVIIDAWMYSMRGCKRPDTAGAGG
jgi:hypothetical protein